MKGRRWHVGSEGCTSVRQYGSRPVSSRRLRGFLEQRPGGHTFGEASARLAEVLIEQSAVRQDRAPRWSMPRSARTSDQCPGRAPRRPRYRTCGVVLFFLVRTTGVPAGRTNRRKRKAPATSARSETRPRRPAASVGCHSTRPDRSFLKRVAAVRRDREGDGLAHHQGSLEVVTCDFLDEDVICRSTGQPAAQNTGRKI